MSIETGLFKILSNDAGVSAIVAARIYPVVFPEGALFPAIAYQRISTPRENTLDQSAVGQANLPHPRFQFSCVAADFTTSISLAAAVKNLLAGFSGLADDTTVQAMTLIDTRDFWDMDVTSSGAYRRDLDFEIWHAE